MIDAEIVVSLAALRSRGFSAINENTSRNRVPNAVGMRIKCDLLLDPFMGKVRTKFIKNGPG